MTTGSRFKTPARAPATANTAAEDWVKGGADTAPALEPVAKGKAARLTIDLPQELHAQFKAKCALQGTRMGEAVTRFIESYTQQH